MTNIYQNDVLLIMTCRKLGKIQLQTCCATTFVYPYYTLSFMTPLLGFYKLTSRLLGVNPLTQKPSI